MSEEMNHDRRSLSRGSAMTIAAAEFATIGSVFAQVNGRGQKRCGFNGVRTEHFVWLA